MNPKLNVLLVGILLASFDRGFGQPIITAQPQNQAVSLGDNVTFSVSITGGAEPFAYQWLHNGGPLPVETTATLTLSNVQFADAGRYAAIVTDAFEDATTSEAAILAVVPSFTRITMGDVATDAAHSFGCAWGDYDGDGYLDLIVGNGGDANALYHNNRDGSFTRIRSGAIATTIGDTTGCTWGDFDNDGDLDLFVANWQRPSFLFRNGGAGNFTRITAGSMGTNSSYSNGCAWGDYDNDGYLDLIVANAGGQNEYLYRNNGEGTFTQVITGIVANSGRDSTTPLWADYDNDGDLDLFLVSYQAKCLLFCNDGNGNFDVVNSFPSTRSLGGACDWGDFDNDGYLDLLVSQWGGADGANEFLYRNNGDGTFTQIFSDPVVSSGGSSTGCTWGDFDNDGWLDLFVANDFGQNNFLFHNNGDGTFTRVTQGSIVNDGGDSGGCAWADYDNDGFLDLLVINGGERGPEPSFLYHNEGNSNRWLSIKCVGAASNRSGLGAKVRVRAVIGGVTRWQLREVNSGNGFSGSGLRAHFGLGDATNADLVHIEWPSGTVQQLQNVAANQFLTVTEPPRLQAMGFQPGGWFQFRLTGGVGFRYSVEWSSNLVIWNPWMTVTNTSRSVLLSDPVSHEDSRRFYRAVTQ